jgi:exodeoxyribonuclease V alpha subunit
VHLDEPQRCHNHNLLELYEIIQKGSFEDFYKKIDTSSNDIQVIKKPLQNLSYETLQELISFFKDEHFYYDDFYEITFKIDSIILSTLRRGLLGVDMINKELSTYFINKNLNKRFYIEPIMMIESFKEQNLFNGETGFKIYDRHKEITFFQFDKKTLPYLNESSYTQAFALSVHKSQGSEYQRVLFMIPQGSERFSLEIIYTAITRVKQTLFMWFDKEPLKEAFSKRNLRYSGLRHRCKN